ncbi:trypsin-like peptidase domain-containing protein [Bradyrhizobium sp. NP1]|uniref:S1C family serine protease n=1 Tax=Bradyrhizobium sp. NP1 TaxID=3049772 RepID=UPI0025A4FD6D|nr:trypsin-like peptidase domain-containing protein [Bradyrhizobium sp. NP1]WJR78239.1 trypsin-like peptidase domain-containing protein [Bradyrhizobium sp. NP1]
MIRSFVVACAFQLAVAATAQAAGPFGSIRVGNWVGGAFTDDNSGAFSHCAATTTYASGVSLVVGQNATNSWLLSFASSAFRYTKGEGTQIDVLFDGQMPARLFANANSQIMTTAILPPNIARVFQKASLMVANLGGNTLQFNLTSTGPLIAAIATCVAKVKADGINSAGDFSAPKMASAGKPAAPGDASAPGKPAQPVSKSGTGFVISPQGHIVTNQHVISGCNADSIRGNLGGQPASLLRVVSSDERNDLAVLQGPADTFKSYARIRDRSIRSGDSVVAIGYPFHGLLSSDFTVTTGIVSSLSGTLNDTRVLQISAAVQPGNSGGPLLDTSGLIVGMVAAKLDALRVLRVTGNIPENINFAIKTGMIRDFLDNSVVPYETAATGTELKTAEVADKARAFTLLITCTGKEPAEAKR